MQKVNYYFELLKMYTIDIVIDWACRDSFTAGAIAMCEKYNELYSHLPDYQAPPLPDYDKEKETK